MKIYKVMATFDAEIEVHAESAEEAIEKARKAHLSEWDILEEAHNLEVDELEDCD